MKVILITGASSGIGHAAAIRLAAQGQRVYAAARRVERMSDLTAFGVTVLPLDVTDPASAQSAVAAVLAAEGRVDVLINNAGYGSFGPIEQVPLTEASQQLAVNVLGMAAMIKLVLPIMREQGGGRIVNLSSVGGRVTCYLGGWYHASKYAVEALSDALRMEAASFGVKVVLVEPGAVHSEWGGITADHLEASAAGSVYAASAAKVAASYRHLYAEGAGRITGTEQAARMVARAAVVNHPRARYLFGFAARPLVFLHTLLPAKMFDALMRAAYEKGWMK